MITTAIEVPSQEEYERMACEYMASLPLEHYMEGKPNAFQRKITLESFDLVTVQRPEVHLYSELLVQYPRPNQRTGQVVPDNMVVLQDQPSQTEMSFNIVHEDATILMVLEWVSRGRANQRKDYETNRKKYERELRVPYYLLYDPDELKLTLLRLEGTTYADVKPNAEGRLPIRELDMEIAVLDGWVRYWYQGKLLPLPAEMQAELDELHARAEQSELRAKQETQRAEQEKQRAEQEMQRAEQEKQRADAEAERARKLADKLRSLGVDPGA